MRCLAISLVLLAACELRVGGHPPVDASARCPTMVFDGEACQGDLTCTWSEGLDGGTGATSACTCSGGHWTCQHPDACPASPPDGMPCAGPEQSCSYSEASGAIDTCACTSTGWRCNDCPWSSPPAIATCTSPGAACSYEDWEHGCDCSCDASGFWSCTPETVGSTCPHVPPPDAGM